MQRALSWVVSVPVLLSLISSAGCNRRVFAEVQSSCETTIAVDQEVPTEKAADILIVVDNSGSMAEEQQELVNNFLNQNADQCPLQDLQNIPNGDEPDEPDFTNPSADLYTGDGPLAQCGFIQLLAAFENDFRVGVITTDVGECDNVFGRASDGLFRPQRGCLQPDGPPGTDARKVIAASDLDPDSDPSDDDFAQRFRDTLSNISVFGSSYERGLDAMSIFLDPNARRAQTCESDLELFRRPNASLVVIFLTDEEDCSHGLGDGSFFDELQGAEGFCGKFSNDLPARGVLTRFATNTARCYDDLDKLPPPSLYADALLQADPNAKVAVIAGGLGEPGSIEAAGCLVGNDGAAQGGCFDSGGQSNLNGPNETCGSGTCQVLGGDPFDCEQERGGLDCCLADPGARYYAFADAVGQKATDSICNGSFRSTMIDIARFIAAVDFVELAEAPVSQNAILVEITRAADGQVELVSRLDSGDDCAVSNGWFLEGETRVVFCGSARPKPGDGIAVRAKGTPPENCQ